MLISELELKTRLENFKQVINKQKLPLTPQKLAIFQSLATTSTHPNVQEIYDRVKEKFSNISLATVYKNLKKFTDLGLSLEILIPGEATRYDAKLGAHSHVVNIESNRVYDLKLPSKLLLSRKIMGKKVKKIQLIYYI